MEVDHLFVCIGVGAPEAELLLAGGFAEGAPNTHSGQGTACRRFFFRNAYLELCWVADEAEVRGAATAPTRLGERWRDRSDGRTSPFGLCLRAAEGEPIPFPTRPYRPAYLPPGVEIPVALGFDDESAGRGLDLRPALPLVLRW